jgi:SNF2 family DNA or RNA helicase
MQLTIKEKIREKSYDLAVFDETHHLRNFYTNENKTATVLNDLFKDTKKLLLTATPLQKNVMDLYGLMKFIDELF